MKIKKKDDAIKIIQVSKLEIEDIQLGEDLEKEVELAPAISYQNGHKAKNLDIDINTNEAKAKDNDLT